MKTLCFLCFLTLVSWVTAQEGTSKKTLAPNPTPADMIGSWIMDDRTYITKDDEGADILRVILRPFGDEEGRQKITFDECMSKCSDLSKITKVLISSFEINQVVGMQRADKFFYISIKGYRGNKEVYERTEVLNKKGMRPIPEENPKPSPPPERKKKKLPDGGRLPA